MNFKLIPLNVALLSCLLGCGGGGGSPTSSASLSSSLPSISTFSVGNKPSKRIVNGIETFPTMVVTINFKSNVELDSLSRLSVTAHISADDIADYVGNEFAYIFENSSTSYKWTYSDVAGYCCTNTTETYYEANNSSGFLQLKLFYYGRHTLNTWNKLKAGTLRANITAKYFQDKSLASVISTDYLPGKDVFSVNELSLIDGERDYLGNDASADIATASFETFFN